MTVERAAIESRVAASIDAGRIPVLLGGCGLGRTTLLRQVAERRSPGARYIDIGAVATTPERCLVAVSGAPLPPGTIARGAFDRLLDRFDRPFGADGQRATFCLDEFQELRTFENFPGLRDVQREFIARLAASPNQFALASRFTARAHRLLRDAPARFEVIHLPPLDLSDVEALAQARDGRNERDARLSHAARADRARQIAPAVLALSGGRVAYATALLEAIDLGLVSPSTVVPGAQSVAESALADLVAPGGRLTALSRFSYEFRLHRARGYGALKAILGILAHEEPLTLTDIAHRLHRTPGSTKDYLSWLEDVDMVTVERKKYAFDDPLVRLYVRLHTGAEPPTAERIAAEVRRFAGEQLSRPTEVLRSADVARTAAAAAPPVVEPAPASPDTSPRDSGIIEID